jgi:hypothetical protein
MPKKAAKRVRRPCVPDDFEDELTQEECDMIDKWFPQYEDEEVEGIVAEERERVKCCCGSLITLRGMKSHEKTKKHLDALRTIRLSEAEDLAFKDEVPEEILKIDSILI